MHHGHKHLCTWHKIVNFYSKYVFTFHGKFGSFLYLVPLFGPAPPGTRYSGRWSKCTSSSLQVERSTFCTISG